MKKFIAIILALIVLVSCASPRMIQVGNITLRDRKGEVVSYYERARIVNLKDDQVTSIRFVTRDGVEHYIEEGERYTITVDGVEYVQERNNHVYIVETYPYWYYRPGTTAYPYHPYYNRRPYYQPAPRGMHRKF